MSELPGIRHVELPRRVVLRRLSGVCAMGAATFAAAGLSACGIRLESDAPVTAPTATRPPVPDSAVLRLAADRATHLAQLAGHVHLVPAQQAVAQRHTEQAALCRRILAAGGIPTAGPTEPTTEANSPTNTLTRTPTNNPTDHPATLEDLARAEAERVSPGWTQIAAARTYRALLVSLATHDAATADLLGAEVSWPDQRRLPVAVASAQLVPTRAAVYGLQVAAARLPRESRATVAGWLATVKRRADHLAAQAGTSAPPPPLGYRVPGTTNPRIGAAELARAALVGLRTASLAGLDDLPHDGPDAASATAELARLATEAVVLAALAGEPVPVWPGLVTPVGAPLGNQATSAPATDPTTH